MSTITREQAMTLASRYHAFMRAIDASDWRDVRKLAGPLDEIQNETSVTMVDTRSWLSICDAVKNMKSALKV
jgi:hypothetical protein